MKKMSLLFACVSLFCAYADAFRLPGNMVTGGPAPKSSFAVGSPAKGITVAGGNGQGSSSSQLNSPLGIILDKTGNIYICDQPNNRIQKWAPGAPAGVTVAGGNGRGPELNKTDNPIDVFLDKDENIFVCEGNYNRIQKWIPGASSGIAVAGGPDRGRGPDGLADPFSIFIDASGYLYINDQSNQRIQKWAEGASEGVTLISGVGPEMNQLRNPAGIFVDQSGNLYIADRGNYRVQKWAPGTTSGITVAGGHGEGQLDNQLRPSDVFVDLAGNLYVTDDYNHRVQKWAPGATNGVTVAGGNGAGSAADQLNFPQSLFVDPAGNIYVSDSKNNRVQKFPPDQLVSCLPGLIFTAPSCNGKAVIHWPEPHDSFPATIAIPGELDLTWGRLDYIGEINGHGYYKSSNAYPWPIARDIAFYVGDTNVNGHLLTISGSAENNFIFNLVKSSGYSPWMGLYNTGKPGQFAWVTGEPLGYTNWGPGEPNNYRGNAFMKEPYVRFMESYGNWNDQQIDNLPFIAEFEAPLIRYRQISGPANGSDQSPGVYTVCYEKINHITDEKETCCFTVTVTCASTLNATMLNAAAPDTDLSSAANGGLRVTTSPNPSRNYFRLKMASNRQAGGIDVKVTNALGKLVESRKGMMPGQTLEIGTGYHAGIYFAEVTQGNNKVMIKMVKQ